jgi:DNA-directed RNA polymerase sigma subunit (sigma70/sigma32)
MYWHATKELVRVPRQRLHETGREASPEELAERLGNPLNKVGRWLKSAKVDVRRGPFGGRFYKSTRCL